MPKIVYLPIFGGLWVKPYKRRLALRAHEFAIPPQPGFNIAGWRWDHATQELAALVRTKANLHLRPDGKNGMLDGTMRAYLKGTPIPRPITSVKGAPPFIDCDVPHQNPFTPGNPKFMVLHTTSGYGSVEGLASFFRQGVLGVQWAVDASGRIGRYAPGFHCNHVGDQNYRCEGIEQVGFATGEQEPHVGNGVDGSLGGGHVWTGQDWLDHRRDQLDAVSWLLAYRCPQLGIPIVRASNGDTRGFSRSSGVVGHINCPDNSHVDPGPDYPWELVLGQAARWAANGVPSDVADRIRSLNKKKV